MPAAHDHQGLAMTLYIATMLLALAAAFVTIVGLTQAELPVTPAALVSGRA